jgi:BMFP domain-containing protein YqiC
LIFRVCRSKFKNLGLCLEGIWHVTVVFGDFPVKLSCIQITFHVGNMTNSLILQQITCRKKCNAIIDTIIAKKKEENMLDPKLFDEISQMLTKLIPDDLRQLRDDLDKNIHAGLQSLFAKLNLVTREEFDAQVRVLQRTREKLELLEQKIKDYENRTS